MERPAKAMESSNLSDEVPSPQGPTETTQSMPRVITVASLQNPVFSHSLPSASLRGLLPKRHSGTLSHRARFSSLIDPKVRQRTSVGVHRHWRDESRVLPSCQRNSRRNSVIGSRSCNSSTDLTRRASDVSLTRHSLDNQRNGSSAEAASAELYRSDKRDSGIVPDEFPSLSLVSASTEDLTLSVSNLEDCGDTGLGHVHVTYIKSLSEFQPAAEDCPKYTKSGSTADSVDTRGCFSRSHHRNHSESDSLGSYSKGPDAGAFRPSNSMKSKCLPKYHSLECLNLKENGTVSQDITRSVFVSSEINKSSPKVVPELLNTARLHSYSANQLTSASVNDDADPMKDIWGSSIGSQFVRVRSSRSSEDFSDDVLLSAEDVGDETTGESHEYFSDTVPDPDEEQKCFQNRTENTLRDSDLQSSKEHTIKEKSDREHLLRSFGALDQPCGDVSMNFPDSDMTSQAKDCEDSSSENINCIVDDSQSKDEALHPSINPSAAEQYDEQEMSQSLPWPLRHLQATLTVVEEHTKFKATSFKLSKISVQNSANTDSNSSKNSRENSHNREDSENRGKVNDRNVISNQHDFTVAGVRKSEDVSPRHQIGQSSVSSTEGGDHAVSSHEKDEALERSPCASEPICLSQTTEIPPVAENEATKRTTRNDASISQTSQRKPSSRVEWLLNNDLFRKHLAGHIDEIERNILKVKKMGLKKKWHSNFDLTRTESEQIRATLESSLKRHDGSATDDPETNSSGLSLNQGDGPDFAPNEPLHKISVQNATTDPKITRRMSLACDDPSLQQLHELHRRGKQLSQTVSGRSRGRMHIPSFDEFRKERQREQVQSSRALSGLQGPLSVENSVYGQENSAMYYRPLDTVTEDENVGASRSTESLEAKEKPKSKNSKKLERICQPAANKLLSETSMKNDCPENAAAEDSLTKHQKKNDREENASQPDTDLNDHDLSTLPKRLTRSATNTEQQKPEGWHHADQSSTEKQTDHPIQSQSKTRPRTSNLRPKTFQSTSSDAAVLNEVPRSSDAEIEAGQKFSDLEDSANAAYNASSSLDDCTPDDLWEGEVADDQRKSPSGTSKSDFPHQLFDDFAVSLDTESWTRLFTQIHKPRKRERYEKRQPRRKQKSKEEKYAAGRVLRSSSDVTVQMTQGPGLRSSSDVTAQMNSRERQGERKRRVRKERPYKSDPLADGAGGFPRGTLEGIPGEPIQGGSPMMPFLEEAAEINWESRASSFPSLEELTEESSCSEESDKETPQEKKRCQKRLSVISTASVDSGVLAPDSPASLAKPAPDPQAFPEASLDTAYDHQLPAIFNCLQCSHGGDQETPGGGDTREERVTLCDKCLQRQQERKETIYEIIETEINYGRDLRILKEEFYLPMQATGLLTAEQLDSVFLNLDELLTINVQLTEKLRTALHNVAKASDHELTQVSIGSLFIESSTMFLAFENYCLHQAQASASLEQLEREQELVRIFLQVSQAENGLLRRMHLKSFLMVPVQRIMKYPLLLNRLYKATPAHHGDKEDIRQAREKIEDILGHINARAKENGNQRTKRKQSGYRRYSLTEKIEVNRVGLEMLGWTQADVRDLITSKLWYAQPSDHTWASKRCRNVRFTLVHAVLFVCRLQNQNNNNNNNTTNNQKKVDFGQQAAVVLVREKNGKYQAVRDPVLLEKTVVTVDPDCDDVFELQEWGREAYIFKAEDPKETRLWVQHLRQQTHNLGQWRRRRNALPNIMLQNV